MGSCARAEKSACMNCTVKYQPYTMRQEKKVERRTMPLIHCAVLPVWPVLSRNLRATTSNYVYTFEGDMWLVNMQGLLSGEMVR